MGTYVGFATVGAFVAWYMHDSFLGLDLSQDGHSTVTWYQLTHWNQCSSWRNFHVRAPVRNGVLTVLGNIAGQVYTKGWKPKTFHAEH